MSVRARLGLTFVVVIGLFLVPVLYAGGRLSDLRELAVERRRQHAAATLALGALRAGLVDFDNQQRAFLATLDPRMGPGVQATIEELRAQRDRLEVAGYGTLTSGLTADLDSVAAGSRRLGALVRAGAVAEATRLFRRLGTVRAHMAGQIDSIAAAVDRASTADLARAEALSATAAATTLWTTLAVLLLTVGVGAWTTRALTGPLDALSVAAAGVADGAFEAPGLPYDRSDEIGALSRSFRSMANRLGELDRMKAEFMSAASHELKTPINVIHGYAELIRDDLGEDLADRHRELLDAIAAQTGAMARLTSRLLDIGRLEAGAYQMEIEPIHLEDFLTALLRAYEVKAEDGRVRIRTAVEPTAPERLHADPDLLRDEVLGNLLSNAIRFTPADGVVRVGVRGEADAVVFEVTDTGPGIPEEHRPHIFEKYYEGGRTRAVGAGLGLAVAKEVIEAHGGTIVLDSQVGEGATFRVFLPRSPRTG